MVGNEGRSWQHYDWITTVASILHRGERWIAQVYKHGSRKSRMFDTKTAAKAWAAKMEAELERADARGYASAGGDMASTD
jgi:hypothetical protein